MSAYVQTVVGSDSPPVGAVMDFAGNVEPSGWLFCFGQSLPRTGIYAQLFSVIGALYGSVDGSSFSLPDFRGRVGAGKDNMGGTAANRLQTAWGVDGATLGANGGGQSHQLTTAQLPSHTHGFRLISGSGTAIGAAGTTLWRTDGFASDPTGGDGAHPNVQPTFVVNKIIKYTVSGTVLPIVPGEGDVVGPNGGVADGDLAVFNGTSGKIVKRGSTFVDPKVSYAGLVCRPSVVLYNNPNLTAVTGTTATVWTFDVVTGLLGKDGDALRLTVGWFNNATAVAKNMIVRFGGVTGHTTSASGATAVWWSATISITRITATTQRWFTYRTNDALQGGAERFDGSIDTTVNQPLVLQISSTSTGNVQHFSSILEYLPAP